MRWFRRRRRVQQERHPASAYVDLGQDEIRYNDDADATSLLLTLTMRHGAGYLQERPDGQWLANFQDKGSFFGPTPLAALQRAKSVLEG